jgi:hypothetical protein
VRYERDTLDRGHRVDHCRREVDADNLKTWNSPEEPARQSSRADPEFEDASRPVRGHDLTTRSSTRS